MTSCEMCTLEEQILSFVCCVLSFISVTIIINQFSSLFNTLNVGLNPICLLLALLGPHHILHVSRIRFKEILALYIHGLEVCIESGK